MLPKYCTSSCTYIVHNFTFISNQEISFFLISHAYDHGRSFYYIRILFYGLNYLYKIIVAMNISKSRGSLMIRLTACQAECQVPTQARTYKLRNIYAKSKLKFTMQSLGDQYPGETYIGWMMIQLSHDIYYSFIIKLFCIIKLMIMLPLLIQRYCHNRG